MIIASLILSHAVLMALGFLIGRTERSEEKARRFLQVRTLLMHYHHTLTNVIEWRARLLDKWGHGPELTDWTLERDKLRTQAVELVDRL